MTLRDNAQYESEMHITGTGHSHSRRSFLTTSAAAGALSFFSLGSASYAEDAGISEASSYTPGAQEETDAIRPFRTNSSEADLMDLRRRIATTRWPDRETA